MSGILKISEAVSLGIHACVIIAGRSKRISRGEIADQIGASEHHLAKVLRQLVKRGIIKSSPGPGGGFTLGEAAEEITLLQIYEGIEGSFPNQICLLNQTNCTFGKCPLGSLLVDVNQQVRDFFHKTTLASIVS